MRLTPRLLIAGAVLLATLVVAPSTAHADHGDCARGGSYVSCLFVKSGLAFVSNKLTDAQGAQYKCAHSRIAYYNSAGSMILRVVGPETCANALQYIDYPGPYEKTYAKKVCARWQVVYPVSGYTPLICLRAPW